MYIKYNKLPPKKQISIPIIFLLKLMYHLIYLLVNKFINLSLYTNIMILIINDIIKL